MHVERLERLERCLREYAINEFNRMERLHDDSHWNFVFNLNVWSSYFEADGEGHCGTTGCAIGLAINQKLFKAEGLRNSAVGPLLETDDGRLFQGFEAIYELFGLWGEEARYLFSPQHHTRLDKTLYGPEGALACADRIRELIGAVQPTRKLEHVALPPTILCAERDLELA